MASITTHIYDQPAKVRLCYSQEASDAWQAVKVELLDFTLSLSREEAAQLAADILDCISNDAGDIEGRKLMDAQEAAAEMTA